MASSSSIIQAMGNIALEEEEEGGIVIETEYGGEKTELIHGFDAKLCMVGRFITEGVIDFQPMQQTLAALWRPGRE